MSLLKKIMSLGMAGMILLGYPSNNSFAMTGDDIQKAQGESGYRLYADELTPTAGVIKGDISGVLPDNEIINVRQPDGSVVLPEEVNYPIAESGDYTFEIYYETPIVDAKTTKETKMEFIQMIEEEKNTINSLTNSSLTQQSEVLEKSEGVEKEETTSLNESDEDEKEVKENPYSESVKSVNETLILNVKLPEEEIKEAAPQNEEKVSETRNEKRMTSIDQKTNSSNISNYALDGNDWVNSKITWSTNKFKTKWMYGSNQHINYGLDAPDSSSMKIGAIGAIDDPNYGAKFTFGTHLGGDINTAHWLQQGNTFSDITFSFKYDFAIKGAMRIGNSFGANSDAVDNTRIDIDGGVTVSFIPSNQVGVAETNSKEGRGVAYRLGAYGVMPNSIICEFDTSTDTYYKTWEHNPGDKRSFEIFQNEIEKIGDFKYVNKSSNQDGNAFPELNDKNIYDLAKDKDKYKGQNYENIAHIGISTTGDNGYVQNAQDEKQSSRRVALGTSNTGTMEYEVRYDSSTKQITFKLTEPDKDIRSVSMDLTSFLSKQGLNKDYKLAFSYGAAYVNLKKYADASFFNGKVPDGTIDIWATELLAKPDLQVRDTDVRWLTSPTDQIGTTKDNNAYWNNGYKYNNRGLWPVAGDRVYYQFSFDPHTSLITDKVAQGTLDVGIKDKNLAVNDKNGKGTGLAIPPPQIYYKIGSGSWTKTVGTGIPVNGKDRVYLRFELKLPKIPIESDLEGYYISGKIEAKYKVNSEDVTYTIPLMHGTAAGEKISVSRPPKFIGYNGQDFYNNPRVIKSNEKIEVLKHRDNAGDKDSGGRPKTFHYGVGYKLYSLSGQSEYSMYNSGRSTDGGQTSDVKQFIYTTATMDDLGNKKLVSNPEIVKADDSNIDDKNTVYLNNAQDDRRFVIEYRLQDQAYYKDNVVGLTGNADRFKTTGKRVIWSSDNVEVANGYEFFAEGNVTMNLTDFSNFDKDSNKQPYYKMIADKAGSKIFKTSNYDFTNIYDGQKISVNDTEIKDAMKNPGVAKDVTLKFKGTDGKIVTRTIKLTLTANTPKVVSVDSGKISDTKAEKVIFSDEDFVLSSTFKLVDNNGSIVNYEDLKDKSVIKLALYKMNPSKQAPADTDSFSRWANRTNTSLQGQDAVSGKRVDKVIVPKDADIIDNKDGTFTVKYKLLDDPLETTLPRMNWITEKWDNHSEYRVYCWTDTNDKNINYDNLSDTATNTVKRSDIGKTVPSVTTKMYLHAKDQQGNLPSAMFRLPSTIKLYENGASAENFGEDLMITFEGEYNPSNKNVQHDSKYTVNAQINGSTSTTGKPYILMQSSKENFKAYYFKQNGTKFEEIADINNPLGEIGFAQNGHSPILRFGIRGQKPLNADKNDVYSGTASFKFTRQKIY